MTCRCKLIHIHTEAAITCNINADLIRLSKLCSDTGAKAISHRSKSTGGKEGSRHGIGIILGCPHLMLSDICCNNGLTLGNTVNFLHDVRTG